MSKIVPIGTSSAPPGIFSELSDEVSDLVDIRVEDVICSKGASLGSVWCTFKVDGVQLETLLPTWDRLERKWTYPWGLESDYEYASLCADVIDDLSEEFDRRQGPRYPSQFDFEAIVFEMTSAIINSLIGVDSKVLIEFWDSGNRVTISLISDTPSCEGFGSYTTMLMQPLVAGDWDRMAALEEASYIAHEVICLAIDMVQGGSDR